VNYYEIAKNPLIYSKIQTILGRMKNKKIKVINKKGTKYLDPDLNELFEKIVEDIFIYYVSFGMVPIHYKKDRKFGYVPYIPNVDLGKFGIFENKKTYDYGVVWLPENSLKLQRIGYEDKKVKIIILNQPLSEIEELKKRTPTISNKRGFHNHQIFAKKKVFPNSLIHQIKETLEKIDFIWKSFKIHTNEVLNPKFLIQETLPPALLNSNIFHNLNTFMDFKQGKPKLPNYDEINQITDNQFNILYGLSREPAIEQQRKLEEIMVQTGIKKMNSLYEVKQNRLGPLVTPAWIPTKDKFDSSHLEILHREFDQIVNTSFGFPMIKHKLAEGYKLSGNILNNTLKLFFENISIVITEIYKYIALKGLKRSDTTYESNRDSIHEIRLIIDYDKFTPTDVTNILIKEYVKDVDNLKLIMKQFLDLDLNLKKPLIEKKPTPEIEQQQEQDKITQGEPHQKQEVESDGKKLKRKGDQNKEEIKEPKRKKGKKLKRKREKDEEQNEEEDIKEPKKKKRKTEIEKQKKKKKKKKK